MAILSILWDIFLSSTIMQAKHSVRDQLIQPRFSAECFAPTICDLWHLGTNPFRIHHDRDRPHPKFHRIVGAKHSAINPSTKHKIPSRMLRPHAMQQQISPRAMRQQTTELSITMCQSNFPDEEGSTI
jgi:hypothetical protein